MADDTVTEAPLPQFKVSELLEICGRVSEGRSDSFQDGVDACMNAIRQYAANSRIDVVPPGYRIVPIKITQNMIERAVEAHYGKRNVRLAGGAGGVSMTVDGEDWSAIDAMRNFWRGALAAAPAVEPVVSKGRARNTKPRGNEHG